jgi:ribose transport system substrate-binding protein
MKQRKLWILSAIAFAVFLYLIVSFARTTNDIHLLTNANTNYHKPKYHFVLVAQEYDNPYFRTIEKGAEEEAKKYDAVIDYVGPYRSTVAEQLKFLDQAIAEHVDGIITQGLTDKDFTPVIDKAVAAGIPVATIDSDAPSSKRTFYVGTDNYKAGKQLGQAVIDELHGKGNIAIITGSFEANNLKQRVQGVLDVLKNVPSIHVLDIRSSDISRIQAASQTEVILNAYPNVQAFVGTSSLDGLGIYDALRTAQRPSIQIIGFDDLPETVDLIQKGKIAATVVQKPLEMGEKAVQLMVEKKQGKSVPDNVLTESYLLTAKDSNK